MTLLIAKLNHYGIKNSEQKMFISYLDNRKQYVELEGYKSDIVNTPPYSVIQGGKISGLLYTLYTN